MTQKIDIRESLPDDALSIESLYPDAFPDEDLLPLVRDLLSAGSDVISLVAVADNAVVGHVVFTACGIVGRTEKVALLGPLAVAPARQQQGIGKAMVRAGLQRLEAAGASRVYVLGDPAYYGRFGFGPDESVEPPYRLPEEWRSAWQSLGLRGSGPGLSGQLSVPQAWRRPGLWAP